MDGCVDMFVTCTPTVDLYTMQRCVKQNKRYGWLNPHSNTNLLPITYLGYRTLGYHFR